MRIEPQTIAGAQTGGAYTTLETQDSAADMLPAAFDLEKGDRVDPPVEGAPPADGSQASCCLRLPRLPLPSAARLAQVGMVGAGALCGGFIGGLVGLWFGGMSGGLLQVITASKSDIASPTMAWGARIGAGAGLLIGAGSGAIQGESMCL